MHLGCCPYLVQTYPKNGCTLNAQDFAAQVIGNEGTKWFTGCCTFPYACSIQTTNSEAVRIFCTDGLRQDNQLMEVMTELFSKHSLELCFHGMLLLCLLTILLEQPAADAASAF